MGHSAGATSEPPGDSKNQANDLLWALQADGMPSGTQPHSLLFLFRSRMEDAAGLPAQSANTQRNRFFFASG